MLELYDFTLFAILLPVLVGYFFPVANYSTNILIGYVAFAISFLIAPFGSIVWGYIGDKFGSYRIFKISLLLMAFPSLAISMLPTYHEIGWAASIMLIVLRVFQGFSASGEVLGSKIYALESMGRPYFLLASAVISGFGAIGVLAAVSTGKMISAAPAAIESWSWRIPFLVSGLMILLITLIRLTKPTSSEFKPQSDIALFSVINIIRKNPNIALKCFVVSAILGIFSYFTYSFLINFQAETLGYELAYAYQNIKLALLGTVVTTIILAFFHNKLNRDISRTLNRCLLLCTFTTMPLYLMLLSKNSSLVMISLLGIGGLLGLFASISGVYVIASFFKEERCRGALLVNAFGIAIFGGLTPLGMSMFAEVDQILPGAVLSLSFALCYIVVKRGGKHEIMP